MNGSERLWRIWWLWGIPLAWVASALVVGAELVRNAGNEGWGSAFDVLRLAIYWFWMRAAWKCSRNVENRLWTPLSRGALAAGLVANVLI